jgi:hypothetical protein
MGGQTLERIRVETLAPKHKPKQNVSLMHRMCNL